MLVIYVPIGMLVRRIDAQAIFHNLRLQMVRNYLHLYMNFKRARSLVLECIISNQDRGPVARFTKLSYDISYLMIETTLRVTCDLS